MTTSNPVVDPKSGQDNQDADDQPTETADASGSTAFALFGVYALPIFLAVFVAVFCFLLPDSFATADNFRSILDDQSVVVIAAFAAMLPLIVGQFDLSIGANAALSNTLVVGLCVNEGWPIGLAFAAAVLVSVFVGLVNGLLVIKLQVNAFVATLGMATILAGMASLYTGDTSVVNAPDSLTAIARTEVLGISLAVVYMVVIAAVLFVVLRHLTFGRKMYGVGGNRRAAELTGVPANSYIIGSFVAAGLMAGLAGAILGSKLGASAGDPASALLLPAFAAAFLGATTLTPGRFNVLGTVIAVYFLAVAISGLQQLGAAPWVEPTFNGVALIVAVASSGLAFRTRAARARKEQLQLISSTRADAAAPDG